jgi:RNA polymerase sigma-70 factor (ECF subfamily)
VKHPAAKCPTRQPVCVSTCCVSDADLVQRARQGDAAAFGELIDRHRAAVYRAALAALGSHADAEDAAQDAFLAAYRRLDSFRGDASFKTWLLTITWHQAINRRRGLMRIWRRMVAANRGDREQSVIDDIAAPDPTPEQAAVDDQLRSAIRQAIRTLSPKLRDVLLLVQSGEHTYEEIGMMLGVPLGTIKWRVSEARRKIRQQLSDCGYGDVA